MLRYTVNDTAIGFWTMSNFYIAGSHRWRLNELMARYLIKASDLAKQLGYSKQAIGNLKNRDDMPRIDGERLSKLCDALNILILKSGVPGVIITPADLIEYHWQHPQAR